MYREQTTPCFVTTPVSHLKCGSCQVRRAAIHTTIKLIRADGVMNELLTQTVRDLLPSSDESHTIAGAVTHMGTHMR